MGHLDSPLHGNDLIRRRGADEVHFFDTRIRALPSRRDIAIVDIDEVGVVGLDVDTLRTGSVIDHEDRPLIPPACISAWPSAKPSVLGP